VKGLHFSTKKKIGLKPDGYCNNKIRPINGTAQD